MKKTRILSGLLAGVMVASVCTVGFSASAATAKIKSLKAVNTKTGVKLTWKKVKGVKKYKVYRGKTALKTVSKVTYTDKKAKAGKSYTYKVVAVGKKNTASVKVVRLTAPTISALKAKKNSSIGYLEGFKVTWKKVKGAKKYYVYRKTTGKYSKIKSTTKLTYTDKSANNDTKYTYMVKAVNGKSVSVASATKKGVLTGTPKNVKLTISGNTYTLKWSKVKYASSYTIYDREDKKVKTVKTNSYKGTLTTDNLSVVAFSVQANYGGVSGFKESADGIYIPASSHYNDPQGNVHVKVGLKAKEQFADGAALDFILKASGKDCVYSVDKGTDTSVAEINDNFVITAKAPGKTVFKITYDQTSAEVIKETLAEYGFKFNTDLSTGVAYVHVTVE